MKTRTMFVAGSITVVLIGFAIWFFAMRIVYTPIGKLHENPAEYENKIIKVKGEVANRISILAIKYYILKDNTGEIKVVTKRALPVAGVRLCVRGGVKVILAVGT